MFLQFSIGNNIEYNIIIAIIYYITLYTYTEVKWIKRSNWSEAWKLTETVAVYKSD